MLQFFCPLKNFRDFSSFSTHHLAKHLNHNLIIAPNCFPRSLTSKHQRQSCRQNLPHAKISCFHIGERSIPNKSQSQLKLTAKFENFRRAFSGAHWALFLKLIFVHYHFLGHLFLSHFPSRQCSHTHDKRSVAPPIRWPDLWVVLMRMDDLNGR